MLLWPIRLIRWYTLLEHHLRRASGSRAQAALTCAALLLGCSDGGEECLAYAQSSVSVTVVNADGEPIGDADVSYSANGGTPFPCRRSTHSKYWCGSEVSGDVNVTAQWQGQSGSASVHVGSDGCHVKSEELLVTIGG